MVSIALLALASGVEAEDACPRGFLELVNKSVPTEVGDRALMDRLLKPEIASPQLSEAFRQLQATEAVGDKLTRDRTKCPSSSTEKDGQGKLDCTFRSTEGSIMRVKLDKGKIAYLNPDRGYNATAGEDNKVSTEDALRITTEVLRAFGVPPKEIDRGKPGPFIRELMVAGKDPKGTRPHEIQRAEVHVLLPRHVGGIPVFDSEAKTAINGKGEVARLHIKWQDFHLVPGLASGLTLSRQAVVQRVNAELSRGHQCDSLSDLKAHISYVHVQEVQVTERGGDEGTGEDPGSNGFVPALVVYAVPVEPREDSGEVSTGGQQFTIPLLGSVQKAQ